MSRIGRMPIPLPEGVEVKVDGSQVEVRGPLGELSRQFPAEMTISLREQTLRVERGSDEPRIRALHGLARALLNNMVVGVSQGFRRELQVEGVGYRPELDGEDLVLYVGFSHPVRIPPPAGIRFEVDAKARQIRVAGRRQGAGRPGGRRCPQGPPAGAVQGQRASATRANTSATRPARPARLPEMAKSTRRRSADPASAPSPQEDRRDRRAAPAERVPQPDPDLRAVDRRFGRADNGGRLDPRSGDPSTAGEANKTEQAKVVGRLIAERALAHGIRQVVFDRGGYRYHGRVQALAEAARKAGLEF